MRICFGILAFGALVACGAKSGLFELPSDAGVVADAAGEDVGVAPPDAGVDVVAEAPPDAPLGPCVGGIPVAPWAWTAGGAESESVNALGFDSSGAAYAVGTFAGTTDFGSQTLSAVDRLDIFLQKLGCDGAPLWTRRLGGLDLKGASSGWGDEGGAVAVAPNGSVLVGGQFCKSLVFAAGGGQVEVTSKSCFDGFVVSLDGSGDFQWVVTFGGSGRDRVGGIAVAEDGSIYAAGQFEGVVDFDPGPGQDLRTSNGEIDEFLVKLSPQASLVWARTWGGPATEYGTGHVALTGSGAVVVAGQFAGSADFDPGPGQDLRASAGSDDAFVIAFAPNGERLWAQTFGGASYDSVSAVAVGPDDALHVSGSFYGPADFDPGPGSDVREPTGAYDAYLVRLGADGTYAWTRTWGAAPGATQSMVSGNALAVAADGSVVVAGSFQGQIDFDPSAGVDVQSSTTPDAYDAFVSVVAADGSSSAWWTFGGAGSDSVHAVAAHGSGLAAAGSFGGSVALAPGLGKVAVGKQDAFVVRW